MNVRQKMLVFGIYLFLAITLPALPGFLYFYIVKEVNLSTAVIVGIVTGQFLLLALDPIVGVHAFLKKVRSRAANRRS